MVKEKLYQAPVLLPGPTMVIQCKQYRIPGGHEKISKTVKNYVNAGVMIPIITKRNYLIWTVKKPDKT